MTGGLLYITGHTLQRYLVLIIIYCSSRAHVTVACRPVKIIISLTEYMHMNTFFSSYCWPHICLCQITSSLLAYMMPQCTTGFSPPFYDLGPCLRGMNGKRICRDTFFSHTFPYCLCFFPSFLSVLFSDSSSTDMNTTHHSNSRNIAYKTTTVTLGTFWMIH